jgi:hypothetical protein
MVFEPKGILDEPQVEKTVAMLEEIEQEVDQPFDRYTDLSKIDAIDLGFDFVFRVSLHRRRVYANKPSVKSAFYATSEATLRIARIHVMLTDHSPLRVQIFEDVALAAKWLGVSTQELQLEV